MIFKFTNKHHEIDDVWSFYFKPKSDYRFIEGQFLEIDNRESKRWFSISSNSLDKLIRITTRSHRPSSAFKKNLFQLKKNQEVICSPAMGDFILPKNSDIPLLFVAVGIGITPFISILSNSKLVQNRDIKMIFKVKDTKKYLFQLELENINFTKYKAVKSKLTADNVIDFAKPLNSSLIYLAGPELLMEKLTKDLIDKNIQSHQIITDYFPGYKS